MANIVGVFFDYSQAFNVVDYCILFAMLHRHGMRYISMECFRNYFIGRQQDDTNNGTASSTICMTYGDPQSSMFGSQPFHLFISSD